MLIFSLAVLFCTLEPIHLKSPVMVEMGLIWASRYGNVWGSQTQLSPLSLFEQKGCHGSTTDQTGTSINLGVRPLTYSHFSLLNYII